MGNPDDERTVINVKGVSVQAWEKAKRAAHKQGQPMGAWLSRAAEHLASLEDGPRELPPLPPANPSSLASANLGREMGNPSSLPIESLGALMQGIAAVAAATGTAPAKSNLRRLYALADDHVRDASGLPPRTVRGQAAGKAAGQSLLISGKAEREG